MTDVPKTYFHLLSALRGIAAITVVMRHNLALFSPVQLLVSYSAVDLFYVMSGVVIESTYRQRLLAGMTLPQFAWIRMVRIYPFYILGSIITLVTLLLVPGQELFNGTMPWEIKNRLLLWMMAVVMMPTPVGIAEFPYDHPCWSLFFELAVNFFYAASITKLTMRRLVRIVALCGVGLLVSLAVFHSQHFIEMGWHRSTFFSGFFRAGLSFFMGVLLYRLYLRFPIDFIRRHSGAVSAAVLAAVTLLLVEPVSPGGELWHYILCVFVLFPLLIYTALCVQPGKLTRYVGDFFGDVSYPMYTLHAPLYFLLSSLTIGGLAQPILAFAPWSGVCFLGALICIAYLANKIYDRPLRKSLRGVWRVSGKIAYQT